MLRNHARGSDGLSTAARWKRKGAAETATTPLKVNLIDPGVVRTKMRASAMPGEDPMDVPAPESVTDIFVELALPGCTLSGAVCRNS